jgi:putative ABC transport system permease protein
MNFILKMAWRDTRASRRRLLLFSLAIVLGVAALVAVGSLRDNLRLAIEEQTKSLLGADLTVNSRSEFPAEVTQHFAGLGEERAREISFNSMLAVPRTDGPTRLVQVRAIEGNFPFYGDFDTEPDDARAALRGGMNAVLEESLMVQFGLRSGDKIRLGTAEYTVAGGLRAIPGEAMAVTQMAPRVFVPLTTVGGTGLLRPGSISRHRWYFKFPPAFDVQALERSLRDRFREHRLGFDTIEERKRELGQSISNVNSFLSLVGFASLFLGAIGVASAIHAHVRQKIPTVAILRCLGASARTSLSIYLVQGLGLGLLGSGLGALLGLAVQLTLPGLLRDFLPVSLETSVSWAALASGLGAGVVISVLFALLPLLEVRRVSPLLTLRSGSAPADAGRDWLQVVVFGVIIAVVFAFAVWQTGRVAWGVGLPAEQPDAAAARVARHGHVPHDDALPLPRHAAEPVARGRRRRTAQPHALRHPGRPGRGAEKTPAGARHSGPPACADHHDAHRLGQRPPRGRHPEGPDFARAGLDAPAGVPLDLSRRDHRQ